MSSYTIPFLPDLSWSSLIRVCMVIAFLCFMRYLPDYQRRAHREAAMQLQRAQKMKSDIDQAISDDTTVTTKNDANSNKEQTNTKRKTRQQ